MGNVEPRQLRSLTFVVAAAGLCATAAFASPAAVQPSRIVFAANRAPLTYGEVFRVNPDGSLVDLSNSPAPDLGPAVSPDGKHVAFISSRGGHLALYVVGSDGNGLRRLSPSLFTTAPNEGTAEIVWSPDGRRLAAEISGFEEHRPGLYVSDLRGGWRAIARNIDPAGAKPAWSPGGRSLAYSTNVGEIQVVSAGGKHLWSVAGGGGPAWSANGELGVSANSYTVRVYTTTGRSLAAFPGQAFAWAPVGSRLAVMNGKRLQLRPGGTGKAVLDVRLPQVTPATGTVGITWVDRGRVRIYGGNGWIGYDIAHRRPWHLPPAATVFSSVVAPNGSVAVQQNQGATDEALTLLPPGASSASVLQTTPSCGDDLPFASLQFVPHTQSLVYQGGCTEPSADIYAIQPDGTGLTQLTDTPTDETQPSLSPDGSNVAYVQQAFAESCKGCPNELWRVSANGGTPQQLTQRTLQDASPFDDRPSWSPDSTTIAFERSSASVAPTLSELPTTGGGPVRNLALKGVNDPIWGPKLIAFSDSSIARPVIKTYDPGSGAVHTVVDDTSAGAGARSVGPLAWSADGRLAYIEYDANGLGSIFTVGTNTRPLALAPLLPRYSRVSGLAWSPDATRFAFVATDVNGIGEVYTIGVDGSGLATVTQSIGAVGTLSWR